MTWIHDVSLYMRTQHWKHLQAVHFYSHSIVCSGLRRVLEHPWAPYLIHVPLDPMFPSEGILESLDVCLPTCTPTAAYLCILATVTLNYLIEIAKHASSWHYITTILYTKHMGVGGIQWLSAPTPSEGHLQDRGKWTEINWLVQVALCDWFRGRNECTIVTIQIVVTLQIVATLE